MASVRHDFTPKSSNSPRWSTLVKSTPSNSVFEPKSQRAIAFSVPKEDKDYAKDSIGNLIEDAKEPESDQFYSKDQILESIQRIQQRQKQQSKPGQKQVNSPNVPNKALSAQESKPKTLTTEEEVA